MSGATAASPATELPARVAPRPLPVRPPRRGRWILGFILLAIIAGVIFFALNRSARQTGKPAGPGVRTAVVTAGAVQKTMRVTGSTGAERYVALISPRLRGGRSDSRREAKSFASGQNTNIVVQSNSTPNSSSSSGSTSATADTSGQVASTLGNSSKSTSAAFQSATSRVNRGSTGTSSHITKGASTDTSTDASMGSTSSQLLNTTGGGGGGGDFFLILQKLVPAGHFVRKGDVVAEFDRQNMLLRVEDYQAAAAQTEASFKKLQAELEAGKKAHQQTIDAAQADLDKARLDMKAAPVLSAIEAERARLALEEAEAQYKQVLGEVKFIEAGMQAQLRNAEIDLQQAKIELRRAENNADRMIARAPIDGVAVVQQTFRGSEFAQIQEGDQLYPGMMFLQIVDPRSMVVNATINQVDVESLRIGQRAKVRFDAYPGLEVTAHVYSIGAITRPGGARSQYVKEIPIRLKLDGVDPRVIPDLSVSADIVVETAENTNVAPLSSVFSDDRGATNYVFVQSGGGWERRQVETGIADNLSVAIRSGLRPGEVVAIERPPQESKPG